MKCLSFGKNAPEILLINEHKFDLIEIRLDLADIPVQNLWQFSPELRKKIIVTDKRLNSENLSDFLTTVLEQCVFGFDLDFFSFKNELANIHKQLKDTSTKLIISMHNNRDQIMTYLPELLDMRNSYKCDYTKVVFEEFTDFDYQDLLHVYSIFDYENIITFVSGDKYRWTRFLSYKLYSPITYLALDEYSRTAIGQFTLDEFENLAGILGYA